MRSQPRQITRSRGATQARSRPKTTQNNTPPIAKDERRMPRGATFVRRIARSLPRAAQPLRADEGELCADLIGPLTPGDVPSWPGGACVIARRAEGSAEG